MEKWNQDLQLIENLRYQVYECFSYFDIETQNSIKTDMSSDSSMKCESPNYITGRSARNLTS